MKTAELQQLDRQYLWHPFTHMSLWLADDPLVITGGEGVYVIDSDGQRYIDGTASLWCNVHGHRVPSIDAAIRQQLDKIAHSTLLGLTNEPATLLAERLVRLAPKGLAKVFYSDSGATATEIAFKMAAQYWWNRGQTSKTEFIGLAEAYHGDTVGAMSVGHTTAFHKPYKPLLFKVHYADVTLAAIEAILREHHRTIAAICIEPLVMGASGMMTQPRQFVSGVRELATRYDVLLIADEVATGFGRTGKMFACDHEQVTPDLLCLGKGLTGGYLPVAATLATQAIFDAFLGEPWEGKTFFHGHTFTGNPLGCAAALATLDLIDQNQVIAHVGETACAIYPELMALGELPNVSAVRQTGFMVGVDLIADKQAGRPFDPKRRVGAEVCRRLRTHGVLLRPLGDTIVINPPLVATVDHWRQMIDALRVEVSRLGATPGVADRGDDVISGDF
ncbi:MAG: adenosylmethionine--8-amino-7-oxononanoate transaminase [Tepidisphaeraceae bacterium]